MRTTSRLPRQRHGRCGSDTHQLPSLSHLPLGNHVPLTPSTLGLRRRTFRVGGLMAVTTAAKAGAVLVVAFYLFGGAILFCIMTLGSYYVLMEYSNNNHRARELLQLSRLETRLQRGALRFDDWLRFVISKLQMVSHALVALHRSAVDYSFTVTISEADSLLDLSEVLEESLHLLEDDVEYEPPSPFEIAQLVDATEMFDIVQPEPLPEVDEEPASVSPTKLWPSGARFVSEESVVISLKKPVKSSMQASDDVKLHLPAMFRVPAIELEPLICAPIVKPLVHATVFKRTCESTLMIECTAHNSEEEEFDIEETPKRAPKMYISVAIAKPAPRLVVKPRPSNLTAPQNLHRMLGDVEKMLREASELLAASREFFPNENETQESVVLARRRAKSVRFCETIQVIELECCQDERDDVSSTLYYDQNELDSMSSEYFETSLAC